MQLQRKPFIYQEPHAGSEPFLKRGDSWSISDDHMSFAVADSPLRALTAYTREYPYDDVGGHFADLFCEKFVEYSQELQEESNPSDIHNILCTINSDIHTENLKIGRAYQDANQYDMREIVGAAAAIRGDTLFYGLLEDCYINVLRGPQLADQIQLDYQIMKAKKELDRISALGKLTKYMTKEMQETLTEGDYWEPTWCAHLRNNPDVTNDKGEEVGWGIFNGEENAEHFFQVGKLHLEPGDHILVFTDGMIPVLENEKLSRWLIDNARPTLQSQLDFRTLMEKELEGNEALHKEKTLIYICWDK